jgi:hypothetical protein
MDHSLSVLCHWLLEDPKYRREFQLLKFKQISYVLHAGRNIGVSICYPLTCEKISPSRKLLNMDSVDGRLACLDIIFRSQEKDIHEKSFEVHVE